MTQTRTKPSTPHFGAQARNVIHHGLGKYDVLEYDISLDETLVERTRSQWALEGQMGEAECKAELWLKREEWQARECVALQETYYRVKLGISENKWNKMVVCCI